jgi:hypothetical protein
MGHLTVEAEDQAVVQERATILGYAMGVRGLVKGQKNSHSGLLAKVGETMHTLCILMTVLHRHVVHAFNVERISFFTPIAHFLSVSLTSPLWDRSSLVRLFHSGPSSSSPMPHLLPIFSLACVARKFVAPFSEHLPCSVLSVGRSKWKRGA